MIHHGACIGASFAQSTGRSKALLHRPRRRPPQRLLGTAKNTTIRLWHRKRPSVETDPQGTNQRIWHVVASIPQGRVSTYGDIARFAGLGRAARRVGWALRQLPSDTRVPWHRVINSAGKLSLPSTSDAGRLQRKRLEEEGITVRSGDRIALATYRWIPGDACR
tara:strand:- start:130813 stop:131304 length:492 start_codon:yes stop_codon:yes gene_type:complete